MKATLLNSWVVGNTTDMFACDGNDESELCNLVKQRRAAVGRTLRGDKYLL
jgi:hypothetical protein